ncbi:hypothetical protein T261_6893 [Streptomyces lydicus]|nr:hypothetical protein T261_6893 [Streptomyces lydicus]
MQNSARRDRDHAERAAILDRPGEGSVGGVGMVRSIGVVRSSGVSPAEAHPQVAERWLQDPDGHRIVVTEVPADHPLRYRP